MVQRCTIIWHACWSFGLYSETQVHLVPGSRRCQISFLPRGLGKVVRASMLQPGFSQMLSMICFLCGAVTETLLLIAVLQGRWSGTAGALLPGQNQASQRWCAGTGCHSGVADAHL